MNALRKKAAYSFVFIFFALLGTAFAASTVQPWDRKDTNFMGNSVVRIISESEEGASSGSGFAVSDNMYVTNKHVVEDGEEIFIIGPGKKRATVVRVLLPSDANLDLALLRVAEDIGCIPAAFPPRKEFADIRAGQAATAMGYPGVAEHFDTSLAMGKEGITITKGTISRLVENTDTLLLQLDVAIEHGNSGGPLFDEWGRVIGINALGIDGTSAKFAINAVELLPFLGQQGVEPVYLSLDDIRHERMRFLGIDIYIILLGAAGVMFIAGTSLVLLRRANQRKKPQISDKRPPDDTRIAEPLPFKANLVGVGGIHSGKSFQILSFPFWMGRDPACQVVFPASLDVIGRKHCRIDKDSSGQCFMIYVGSRNGTIVNGHLLTQGMSESLPSGSTILFEGCNESFRFEAISAAAPGGTVPAKPDETKIATANLVGTKGVFSGKSFPIRSFPFWIGRDPTECKVVFPAHLDVISRRHCCIDRDISGKGFTICDDSRNGTIVNGRRLVKGVPEPLASGAGILFKDSGESLRFNA
jgi:pSer/pThr/pTyr-binding forkhead associated (FHA) protein